LNRSGLAGETADSGCVSAWRGLRVHASRVDPAAAINRLYGKSGMAATEWCNRIALTIFPIRIDNRLNRLNVV